MRIDFTEALLEEDKPQLILSLKSEEGDNVESDEWVGFIQTMKIFIKKSFTTANE